MKKGRKNTINGKYIRKVQWKLLIFFYASNVSKQLNK